MAYQYGFSSTMTYMNDWFFVPFFMFGWLPIIIYSKVRSIPEYFERRFNGTARFLATLMILLYMVGYIAIGFLTLATALYKIMGIPLMTTVIVIAVLTAIYMHFGGQTSVIFTGTAVASSASHIAKWTSLSCERHLMAARSSGE